MTPNDRSVMLQECLQMVEAGAGIEEAVAQYPEHAAELRELVALTLHIDDTRFPLPPDPAVQTRARASLHSALAEKRAASDPGGPSLGFALPLQRMWAGVRRFSLLPQALPAALALLLLGGGALAAAAVTGDSGVPLPGLGSSSRQERIEVRGTIRGVDNLNAAMTVVTSAGEERVLMTPATQFEDDLKQPLTLADFQPGDEVKISALRKDGELFATEVEREARPQPAATATPPPAQPTLDEGFGQDDGFDDRDDNRGPGGDDGGDDENNQGPDHGEDGDDEDSQGPDRGEDESEDEGEDD